MPREELLKRFANETDPKRVCAEAKQMGVGPIDRMWLIRSLFGLTLVQAKEVECGDLAEHQGKFIEPVMKLLKEMEDERDS